MLMFKKRNANFFHFASFSRGGQQCSHMAFITLLKYFKWIKKVRLGEKTIHYNFYSYQQICRNGLLRFITRTVISWPERFPGIRASGSNRFQRYFILAPFWSSISHHPFQISDTSQASQLFYQIYSKNILGDVSSNHAREIFDRVNKDVQKYQTSPSIPNFNGSWVLKVTWERLYPSTYPTVNLVRSVSFIKCKCNLSLLLDVTGIDKFR